jgi:hypothetical protein
MRRANAARRRLLYHVLQVSAATVPTVVAATVDLHGRRRADGCAMVELAPRR